MKLRAVDLPDRPALRLLEGAADSAQAHVGPLPKAALPKADNVEA